MKLSRKNGSTSNILRFFARDTASAAGAGKTGLTTASSSLNISTIADVEASATSYTAAGSTVESISTLGTFAAPTATKCRLKEVDATNLPGVYELQLADARFAVSNATSLLVMITCSGIAPVLIEIDLRADANVTHIKGTASAGAAGYIGPDWGNISAPTSTVNLSGTTVKTATDVETDTQDIQTRIPNTLTAGGNIKADAVAISGDATAADNLEAMLDGTGGVTLTTAIVGNITGNLSGSVGSVTGLTAATVHADLDDIQARLPAALGANGNIKADLRDYLGSACPAADTAGYPKVTVKSGTGTGEISLSSGLVRISGTGIDDIWDEVVDGTLTARQSMRLGNSAAGGKLSGAATTNVLVRDIADSKDRIDATVDSDGNRTAVTLDLS